MKARRPNILPTEAAAVADYVRREFSCELVSDPERVDDGHPTVWRVAIQPDPKHWKNISAPAYVYALTEGAINAYRPDVFRPHPWRNKQDEQTIIDYIRSFHLGLMLRVSRGQR